jgi:hypothetical protein
LVAFLPFVNMTFNRISHMLSRHNIKSVGLLPMKIATFLHPWKMYWDWKLQVCTAYPANVVKFTLGRLAIPLIPGSKSIISTFVWLIHIICIFNQSTPLQFYHYMFGPYSTIFRWCSYIKTIKKSTSTMHALHAYECQSGLG